MKNNLKIKITHKLILSIFYTLFIYFYRVLIILYLKIKAETSVVHFVIPMHSHYFDIQ